LHVYHSYDPSPFVLVDVLKMDRVSNLQTPFSEAKGVEVKKPNDSHKHTGLVVHCFGKLGEPWESLRHQTLFVLDRQWGRYRDI